MRREIIQSRKAPPISIVGTITRIKPATEREASETPNMDEAPFWYGRRATLAGHISRAGPSARRKPSKSSSRICDIETDRSVSKYKNAASQNRRKEARDHRGVRYGT